MTGDRVYDYLTEAEARFLDAAVARLIPADELGPGAKEAGVTRFIDRRLAGPWGVHGRHYRMGPWPEATPQQGFQSPLTPQEIYREAIRETDDHCLARHGRRFAFLAADRQDAVLAALEDGGIALDALPSPAFFALLWRNTREGFFSDPLHGGNRDKIGWRLIGFPGVSASAYPDHIDRHGVPYRVEPVSILDILQDAVVTDAQGHPEHKARPGGSAE